MADIHVETEKVIASSQKIIELVTTLKEAKKNVDGVSLVGIMDGAYRSRIEKLLGKETDSIFNEAAKMASLGSALQMIAEQYRKTEEANSSFLGEKAAQNGIFSTTKAGTDKRSWWNKFCDWVTRREPDSYDTTTYEQEKAADAAMKRRLWNVLQNEKYSQSHWDAASLEERKQILQDYMNDVIAIYGLKDVKSSISWDSDATYTSQSITWGYYSHRTHTVTLNERALTDSQGNWDSYELLETVSHELRHAYQHEAIDHPTDYMVSKETIKTWKDNFAHYIDSDSDYEGYRNQPVEVDARDFQVTRDGRY